jgi:hypothetical protein
MMVRRRGALVMRRGRLVVVVRRRSWGVVVVMMVRSRSWGVSHGSSWSESCHSKHQHQQ